MLNAAEPLLRRQSHILHRHVVGKIQPGPPLARHLPQGLDPVGRILGFRQVHAHPPPQSRHRRHRRRLAGGQRAVGGERAIRRPHRHQPRHRTFHRHESRQILAPPWPPVHVAGQVQRRVPATRDRQTIRLDLDLLRAFADGDLAQAQPAPRPRNLRPQMHRAILDARRIRPRVDDRRHCHPGGHQIARHPPRRIGIGKQRHPLPRHYAVAVEVAPHPRGHHDPRPVIILKRHAALQRPRRQHRMARHDPPETLARQVRTGRFVQANPLQRAVGAVVIGPGHRRPHHDPHVRQRLQFGHHRANPLRRRQPAHDPAIGQQPPADVVAFLRQNDIRPGPPGGQGRHQPGRPRADHQHIAERKSLLVIALVMLARQPPKPRRPPDQRLIQPLPERARPHEGLVVEPRAQERRQVIVYRHQVEPERPQPVLAPAVQPLEHLLHCRAHIRRLVLGTNHLDQRVRLLRPGGQNAPGPVIFERPTHQPHVIGQQRRGQRIALVARMIAPIKAEPHRFRAVNQPLAVNPHGRRPATSSTAAMSCVTVLRVTTSHCAQPAS